MAVPAFASISFTFTTGSDSTGFQYLVSDSNKCPTEGPIAAYIGGYVKNTGTTVETNVEATIAGLSGNFALTGTQSATLSLGNLAPGDQIYAAWHISYPCDQSNNNSSGPTANLTITATSDTSSAGTTNITVESAKSQSANAGGQVLSTLLGKDAVIGMIISADVEYDFGNIDDGNEFYLQPAGNTDFDAACLQLVGTEIIASNINAIPVGTVDQLHFIASQSQSGNGYVTAVRYFYRYVCSGIVTVARTYSAQTSGNSLKYTGNYDGSGALVFDFPAGTNPFTITKTASQTEFIPGDGPHITIYTVTITNPSTHDSLIDGFTDTLPVGAEFIAIDASSDVTAANSAIIPLANSTGTLEFSGLTNQSYGIIAGGTLQLIYSVSIPDSVGTHTNSVQGHVGTETIGPASVDIVVGNIELQATKTVETLSGDDYALPGNDVVYIFEIQNTGTMSIDSGTIELVDSLPDEIAFYFGDFDAGFPGMGPYEFTSTDANVTCCTASGEQDYANSFGFGYNPIPGYDTAIESIKVSPSGSLGAGESITIKFRAQIL